MSTTGVVLIEEHAQRVKPPRMLAVPFFFGSALGEADDAEYQHRVLGHAFRLLDRDQSPDLGQLPDGLIPDILMQGGSRLLMLLGFHTCQMSMYCNCWTSTKGFWESTSITTIR